MTKIFGIIGSACVLMLLSGCGEELATEAKKAADEIAKEATKTATKQIEDLKNDTLSQLKQMQGEKDKGEGGEKPEKKSD